MNDLSQPTFETSAVLFNALHALLDEHEPTTTVNRRANARHAYQRPQLLAICDGRTAPAPTDFRVVKCHDLSLSGFSFYTESAPQFSHVVIALGAVPFTFFLAKVVQVRRTAEEVQGYLVGCRFLRRIAQSADWT